jgi:hypothetical protein
MWIVEILHLHLFRLAQQKRDLEDCFQNLLDLDDHDVKKEEESEKVRNQGAFPVLSLEVPLDTLLLHGAGSLIYVAIVA